MQEFTTEQSVEIRLDWREESRFCDFKVFLFRAASRFFPLHLLQSSFTCWTVSACLQCAHSLVPHLVLYHVQMSSYVLLLSQYSCCTLFMHSWIIILTSDLFRNPVQVNFCIPVMQSAHCTIYLEYYTLSA